MIPNYLHQIKSKVYDFDTLWPCLLEPLMDTTNGGAALRDAGREQAAQGHEHYIWLGQFRLLKAIMSNWNREATIDDEVPPDELKTKYANGGKWRGSIPVELVKLGRITNDDRCERSIRRSRHAGLNRIWEGVDDAKILAYISVLQKRLGVQQCRRKYYPEH
jgi:hypothetical protein